MHGVSFKCAWLVMAVWLVSCQALAQNTIEVRGADSKYRFVDWTFPLYRSFMVDLFYVGVPGSNEFNLGGGYGFKAGPSLMIAPLAYAVMGKEGGQRGIKIAALVVFEKAGWKANVFLAHFAPLRGDVSRYQVLDTGDLTRTFLKRWELGVSSGFFHTGMTWSPQIGPLVKLNDRLGAWGLSYRFGPQRELRVTRVIVLKK
ncbi:MAG TPA: hypothetical protein VE398_24150 [Acidobacteriota bacterium]|nr:hypothetical protein [Acidobacteriota bacterium]